MTTTVNGQVIPDLIGEIKLYAGPTAPAGWHICDGRVLDIARYTALYGMIGPLYGGDGITTFALPDLRGRAPVQAGRGAGLSEYALAQAGGVEAMELTIEQLPSHSHVLWADSNPAQEVGPDGNVLAREPTGSTAVYNTATPDVQMASASIGSTGGGAPIDIRQPYLALNFIIYLG